MLSPDDPLSSSLSPYSDRFCSLISRPFRCTAHPELGWELFRSASLAGNKRNACYPFSLGTLNTEESEKNKEYGFRKMGGKARRMIVSIFGGLNGFFYVNNHLHAVAMHRSRLFRLFRSTLRALASMRIPLSDRCRVTFISIVFILAFSVAVSYILSLSVTATMERGGMVGKEQLGSKCILRAPLSLRF